MVSSRDDGRGHWPSGKPRNAQTPAQRKRARRVLSRLERALPARPSRTAVISRRIVADRLGISDRTLRRWLAGEDWPPPHRVVAIERMMSTAWWRSVTGSR